MDMDIPARWEEVTPQWLQQMLAERFPEAAVSGVSLIWESEGNNRRARFKVTYASGAGPEVVFAKAEGPYRQVHASNGNLFNEARMLGSAVSLRVDHPAVYGVLIDEPGLDWLVLMEDVTARGGDPRDSTRPMTAAQVSLGVQGLARMHAQYWDFSPAAVPGLEWVQTWEPTEGFIGAFRARAGQGLERMAGLMPTELAGYSGEDLVEICARYIGALSQGPLTLLHGDAHIGNTYVLPDDSVGFLDWQVVRRGNWSQDVGYFVQGALTDQDRRACERDILARYLKALDRDVSFDDGWLWYCASPAYGLAVWLATLGSDGGAQDFDICRLLAARHARAAVDLDAFEAVKTLA
jgi:hypothetical protein